VLAGVGVVALSSRVQGRSDVAELQR